MRMCEMKLSNFQFNTWHRSATRNEHCTGEGHRPETSGHEINFWHFYQNFVTFIHTFALFHFMGVKPVNFTPVNVRKISSDSGNAPIRMTVKITPIISCLN